MTFNEFYKIDALVNITRADGIPLEPVTFEQMCNLISETKLLVNKDGSCPTAEEIFNYSETGELSMIQDLYLEALRISETRHTTIK